METTYAAWRRSKPKLVREWRYAGVDLRRLAFTAKSGKILNSITLARLPNRTFAITVRSPDLASADGGDKVAEEFVAFCKGTALE